ncbi:MAG: PadR family transcriptional regulator [Chloroflexota bacterium]
MRGFPWSWRQEGDAWEALLGPGGGGPRGPRGWRGPRREERRFGPGGPGGPGEPPPPPPPPPGGGWGPFGGPGDRGNPFGGNPFGGSPFGGPPFGNPRRGGRGRGGRFEWPPFGRGPRVRRGDVRAAALVLLAEQPRNGYQIIQEIAERSDGLWKPSSGSVYPALQQLEDEGLVEVDVQDGRRTFRLTETGRTYVEEHKAELGAPWEAMKAEMDESSVELFPLVGQVGMAVFQVSQAATPAQLEQARKVLVDARRALYQILADEEEATQVD